MTLGREMFGEFLAKISWFTLHSQFMKNEFNVPSSWKVWNVIDIAKSTETIDREPRSCRNEFVTNDTELPRWAPIAVLYSQLYQGKLNGCVVTH